MSAWVTSIDPERPPTRRRRGPWLRVAIWVLAILVVVLLGVLLLGTYLMRSERGRGLLAERLEKALSQQLPGYVTIGDSGTDDDAERFTVEVQIKGETWGRGTGRSKRSAEQAAARSALARRDAS